MRDPKEVVKEATSEIKTDFLVRKHYVHLYYNNTRIILQDNDLADTHAARAFKEYIFTRRKNLRKPRVSSVTRTSVRTSLMRTIQPFTIT